MFVLSRHVERVFDLSGNEKLGAAEAGAGSMREVGNEASGRGSSASSVRATVPNIRTTVSEFEYEAGGEFGVLISVCQIPEHF